MSPRSLLSTTTLFAGLAAALILTTTPNPAGAQGLIDFLWGGGDEWGGDRQTVKFDPKYTPGQIIVSFGDRRLYNITAPGVAMSYPIAVPREDSRWQGTTTITMKRENPSWRPTPEMLAKNPKLPRWVPGGHPMNPLGVRALYLGSSTYRIHGTDAPWTIGQAVSQGCIRMVNKDVLDLYPKVPVGTRVTVTWQRFNTEGIATAYGDQSPPPSYSPFRGKTRRLHSRNISSASYEEAADEGMPAEEAAPEAAVTEYADPKPETPVAKSSVMHAPKPKTAEAKPAAHAKVASVTQKVDKPVKAPAKVETPKAEPAKTQTAKAEPAKVEPAKAAPAKAEPAQAAAKPDPSSETKTAAVGSKQSPAEIAKRAAEAAARAATAAQEAAEAARKAAAAAKKATSANAVDGKDAKDAPAGRRAAL